VVASLANVADELVEGVAEGLGMEVPEPLPRALERPRKPEVETSPALSLFARPGAGSVRTRRIAILVADGVDGEAVKALHAGLLEAGAVPRIVGARLGQVTTEQDYQYRHCKPILALGEGTTPVENAGVPARLASGEEDPGLLLLEKGEAQKALTRFIQAIAKHRHFAREVDPPMV
jgi:catalase